jgi:hypothetical protein
LVVRSSEVRRAAAHQRHVLGGLTPLRTRRELTPGVLEPDQRLTAEVGDQERDVVRSDRLPEPIAKDIDRSHRRRILDRREQFPHVEPRRSYVHHGTHPRRRRYHSARSWRDRRCRQGGQLL